MRTPTISCLPNSFRNHLLSFPLFLLKELSKLHCRALELRLINEMIVSPGNIDRLQALSYVLKEDVAVFNENS